MPLNDGVVTEPVKHIEDIISIARLAGGEILKAYNEKYDIVLKPDHTPYTIADEMSDYVIASNFAKLFPSIPVLSEESPEVDYSQRKDWKQFWLVDPLDGTKEFIKKTGEFCINIAFIEDGKPTFGLIYQPSNDTAMYNLGGTIYKLTGNELSTVKPVVEKGNKIRVVASRSYSNSQTEEVINAIKSKGHDTEIIYMGSALKFCLLAEGKADLYSRLGAIMEWDTAAGQSILLASGGSVISLETGKTLTYNKSSLRNPEFIAASGSIQHLLNDIL